MLDNRRVMLVGRFAIGALEHSYRSAFAESGFQVEVFDMERSIRGNVRFGRAGERLHRFLPLDPWIRKANREMVLATLAFKADLLVVFGQTPVRAGALAQLKTICCPHMVLVWPDTMLNLSEHVIQCFPLYDLIASYSDASVPWFRRLGARELEWIPLAADPQMYSAAMGAIPAAFQADVGFIGGWRPERESALEALIAAAPDLSIKVWGPNWDRSRKAKRALKGAWQGRALYTAEYALAVAGCKINLNIIDPTNYPAANMRFFELAVAGGLQVCSACPEMETAFRDGETIIYYTRETDLPDLVRRLLGDEPLRMSIARAGRELALSKHTYSHRVTAIVERLINADPKEV